MRREEARPVSSPLEDPWLKDLHEAIWSRPEFSMVPIDYEAVPRRRYVDLRASENGLRMIFAGIPSDYGTAFLLHLLEQHADVVAVVCSTRWQRTHPKADLLARIAGHLGRPVEVAADVNVPAFARCLSRYEPDVMIMASFDQILSPPLLNIPRLGWMNIHPSLLPRHRGPEPIYWTIVQGDRESGITLHWTVQRIDAGPILAQRRVSVAPDDTSGTLCKRLVMAGLQALDETLGRLSAGDVHATVPDLSQGSYEPPVQKAELDWDQPYMVIERLVRAGQPDQPPAFTYDGERRYVLAMRQTGDSSGEPPGILKSSDGELLAATRDALVAVTWSRTGHRHAAKPLRKQRFP